MESAEGEVQKAAWKNAEYRMENGEYGMQSNTNSLFAIVLQLSGS
jgi:hypothetical protein